MQSIFVIVLAILVGFYVIWFARGAYQSPDEYIARWQRVLPQTTWAWRLVRGWAAFCVWAGLLIIVSAICSSPPLRSLAGAKLFVVVMVLFTTVMPLVFPVRLAPKAIHLANGKRRSTEAMAKAEARLEEYKAQQEVRRRGRKLKL